MRVGQISKSTWYRYGGFSNPYLYRKQDKRGGWRYYCASN
jgi:hypothetical protein